MTRHSIFQPGYSEQEIADAVTALRKWRDYEVGLIVGQENPEPYPFVVGAVPVLLFAYEKLLNPEQAAA